MGDNMLERSSIVKCPSQTQRPPRKAAQSLAPMPRLLRWLVLPAGRSGAFGDLGAFLRGEPFGPRTTALQSPFPSESDGSRILPAFARGAACRIRHDAGGELVGVFPLTTA